MADEQSGTNYGLAAAASLVVGVLAAVGVAGDLLTRMVRNNPVEAAIPVFIAIVAVAVVAFDAASRVEPAARRRTTKQAVALLTAGLIVAVAVGAGSQNTREHPGVSLALERVDGRIVLHAKATGTSLRSTERMLLQVLAVKGTTVASMRSVCRSPQDERAGTDRFAVVSWTETGPNAKGEAATESKSVAPEGTWTHYCAYAALGLRDNRETARFNWAVVDAP